MKYPISATLIAILSCTLAAYAQAPAVTSTLEIVAVDAVSSQPTLVYSADTYFEAPNWTRDNTALLFDEDGRILKIPVTGGTPTPLDTGDATRCNGSHGLSPDGRWLAISCSTPGRSGSRVYIVPSAGGTPRLVTEHPDSYFHSWSPSGRTILFTRPSRGAIDIYSIAVTGGSETRLTLNTGTNDDPDFAPDGRYIYFNSDRTGSMQIWRMRPDGSAPQQVTHGERVNWTAHPSPDGRFIIFISYAPGTAGHPANQPIQLRLLSLQNHKVRVLASLTGGSGTMNVPSWSPDSRRLAFVSYTITSASVK